MTNVTETLEKNVLLLPLYFHDFSEIDCHLIFRKLFNIDFEKNVGIKGDDFRVKSSKRYLYIKLGCSKLLDSFRFLNSKLAEMSTTKTCKNVKYFLVLLKLL